MSIFKCKMCGDTLNIEAGQSVAVCESCGTQQTLPKLDDDRRANLYDRANHFRRNNEFDKASSIYDNILNEDKTDAEAYWSLVLCRYGIEYVEDPASHKRVPTVNRTQYTSIFDDDNYKSALEYADAYQRKIYEEEANAINEIQKGILAISQKEEPFDVFICYKETDNGGRRTPDSVLANDLYHQLVAEGFKVFFARITLEDKLGTAYEPYIFAALNSAKVMVVLGTKPEYFNAVWVKNEWSRYLSLVKASNGKKVLIPAYKDMDPYDLPDEFSHLQAQDMSKLGFMQDLIRGIKKLAQTEAPAATVKETVVINNDSPAPTVAPLLKRAFMFLEDGDFNSANEYCEKVLDLDPENAEAYLGKLMAELSCKKRDDLKNQAETFDSMANYQKAVRFGNDALKAELQGCIDFIINRNLEAKYRKANNYMASAKTQAEYVTAAGLFSHIRDFKDSKEKIEECEKLGEEARKEAIYSEVLDLIEKNTLNGFSNATTMLNRILDYKDSAEKIKYCEEQIAEIKAEEERKAEKARIEAEEQLKKDRKMFIKVSIFALILIVSLFLYEMFISPTINYNKAEKLYEAGDIVGAYEGFAELGDYKDSSEKIASLFGEYFAAMNKSVEVGSYVTFGAYEQDNNTSNGKENIEWLVLDKKDSKALVISKNALDCQKYNTSYTDVTWDTCSLRKWLNGTFINEAFTDAEKSLIPTVTVSADKNPEYSTNPGNATQDKVFLLSITEANKYFSSDSARQCEATAYAEAQGAYIKYGNCWWWLRSPGAYQDYAAAVYSDGDIDEYGEDVANSGDAVRPALWIEIQ